MCGFVSTTIPPAERAAAGGETPVGLALEALGRMKQLKKEEKNENCGNL